MKTLTQEDITAIGQEVYSVLEKCLQSLNQLETTNTKELLNVDELSEKLMLGKQSVYKLLKEKELKSIKIGKNFYVKKSDLEAYINSKY